MVSYVSTIKKGFKWYRRLDIQLLLGITVVNAFIVYKITTKKNINIWKFSELLAMELLRLINNAYILCSVYSALFYHHKKWTLDSASTQISITLIGMTRQGPCWRTTTKTSYCYTQISPLFLPLFIRCYWYS